MDIKLNSFASIVLVGVVTLIAFQPVAYSENPCGINCTQTIASNQSTLALTQANAFTENAIQTAINTQVYEKIVIWAEDDGALANGSQNWSFGGGATGLIGIPLPEAWEAYAVSFNADAATPTTASVLMRVVNVVGGVNRTLFEFTATGNLNDIHYTETLANPVPFPAGTTVGFLTVTETGTVSNARVAVWLRRHPD